MSYVVGGDGRGKPKYSIESALIAECSYIAIMTIGTLSKPEELAQVPDGCHIYAICTRPRLLLTSAELLREEEGGSTFAFSITTADGKATVQPECPIPVPPGTIPRIENSGATIRFLSPTNEIVAQMPTALLLGTMMPEPFNKVRPEQIDRMMLDLSVEYIGQAYGRDGSRDALDRLASHETLQKILGELNDQQPYRQAWIVVFKFDEYAVANMISPWEGTVSREESITNAVDTLTTKLPGDQLTTLVEGSLIRYFRPPFNERYKDTFPTAEHSSYEHPYKLDINAVGFEFDTSSVGTRLGSDAIVPTWIHMGLFALSDPSVRRVFADIFENPPAFLYPLLRDAPPAGWELKEGSGAGD
jgi:hypothetical protein